MRQLKSSGMKMFKKRFRKLQNQNKTPLYGPILEAIFRHDLRNNMKFNKKILSKI